MCSDEVEDDIRAHVESLHGLPTLLQEYTSSNDSSSIVTLPSTYFWISSRTSEGMASVLDWLRNASRAGVFR
ncbi:hypothetical protein EON62_05735 [archaeon]|nr:MAG: hypothetical protein EON62_05735 [archaeon]